MDERIELEDILAFVTAAERGSVNGAAERLGLAQPIVTRRIQRLEAALGAELFDRTVRPVALTDSGVQALGPCRAALQAIAALRTLNGTVEPRGELRLGVAPALADLALAGSLSALTRRYPGVALRVLTERTPQLLHQLRLGVLDLAVAQLPTDAPPPTGLETRALGVEHLLIVAAREGAPDAACDLAALSDMPWVLGPAGDGARVLLEAALRRRGLTLRAVAELEGYATQTELVAQGVGLGLLPERALRREPLAARLQAFRAAEAELALRIWAAYPRPRAWLADPLTLLLDALAAAVGDGLEGH